MLSRQTALALRQVYHNPAHPLAYGSAAVLLRWLRKKWPQTRLKDVKGFLAGEDTYTRFTRRRSKFPRLRIRVKGPRRILSIDLADFQRIAQFNDGFRYALVAIDAFSRLARI